MIEEAAPLTLLDALEGAARHAAETGISLVPDKEDAGEERRSYARLYAEVFATAAMLVERGVRPGDRVLVVLPTSFDFIVTFFALQRAGAIPVPSYPPVSMERVETALERLGHIANHSGAAWCVTNKKLRSVLGDLGLRAPALRGLIAIDGPPVSTTVAAPTSGSAPAKVGADDLAFLQYTSGSTGRPKGVALTHANVLANIRAIGLAVEVTEKDTTVSWLPLYHDMGLIGALLSSVVWRVPFVLMSPIAFMMRPARWLRAISKHRGTFSPAPNFGYALAVKRTTPDEREGLDLRSWRRALNGAESISAKTVADFERTFAPYGFASSAICPVYGLAEASLALTFPRVGEPIRLEHVEPKALADGEAIAAEGGTTLLSVGRAVPDHEVRVVDASGAPLAERRVGHIVARGPSILRGYFQDPEATAAALKDGWLKTGDLGFFADGCLYVTGREKDLILIRGRHFFAEDIERAAESVEGVREGRLVAFGVYDEEEARDAVVVVCESRQEDDAAGIAQRVTEAVTRTCGVSVDEVAVVAPGTIPRTSSGKLQRSLTRDLYLKDELGPRTTGSLGMVRVFARSAAGLVAMLGRRVGGS